MKTITGNILDTREGVIMHQVNCRGVTGGLAGALRRKWPDAFLRYSSCCREFGLGRLGCVCVEYAKHVPIIRIAHVFGQGVPGPNTNLVAVAKALPALAEFLHDTHPGLPLYAPYQMGCGLGGGNWEAYSALIEKHLPHTILVKLPE